MIAAGPLCDLLVRRSPFAVRRSPFTVHGSAALVLPTSPRRLKLPTLPCRSKLQEATSGKPGGYVGQAVLEKRLRLFRWPNALLSKTPGSLMNLGLSFVRASALDFDRYSIV